MQMDRSNVVRFVSNFFAISLYLLETRLQNAGRSNKHVSGDWPLSIHADPTCSQHGGQAHGPRPTRIAHPHISNFGLLGGAKFPKMGDSLPRTPMNCPAKFDAASFFLGGEICNRTNKQNYKQ